MSVSQKSKRTAYTCPEFSGKLLTELYTFECRDCGYLPYKAT